MIYDNMAPARLDLNADSVIPPLTPCDPNRRKATAQDVQEAATQLLRLVPTMVMQARFVRETERRAEEMEEIFGAYDPFTVDSRSTSYLARLSGAEGRQYAQALEAHTRLKSGTYVKEG